MNRGAKTMTRSGFSLKTRQEFRLLISSGTTTSRSARCHRRGFTAVELLVATALSSMLIVAILGLMRNLHVQCRELTSSAQSEPWHQLLAGQLRRDLANARFVTTGDNQLVLSGYLSTQGSELHSTLRVAEVTYYIAPAGDVPCLLRSEKPLTTVPNATDSQRLLAVGVDRIEIVVPDVPDDETGYSGAVPVSCYVCVYRDGVAKPLVEVSWCR